MTFTRLIDAGALVVQMRYHRFGFVRGVIQLFWSGLLIDGIERDFVDGLCQVRCDGDHDHLGMHLGAPKIAGAV